MREILFRGKLSHSKEWVIGNLILSKNGNSYIIPSNILEEDGHHLKIDSDLPYWVDENTVGQYTGLNDKNGTKIFEGDILEYDEEGYEYTIKARVVFGCGTFYAIGNDGGEYRITDLDKDTTVEVIGNIHDNKDLIR